MVGFGHAQMEAISACINTAYHQGMSIYLRMFTFYFKLGFNNADVLYPSFILKTKEQRAAEKALMDKSPLKTLTLEDFLESERHKLSGTLTPVTTETFAKWKKERLDKKAAEEEARKAKEATGRAMFEKGGWDESEDESSDDEDGDEDIGRDEWDLDRMRRETEAERERKEKERVGTADAGGGPVDASVVDGIDDGDGHEETEGETPRVNGVNGVNGHRE